MGCKDEIENLPSVDERVSEAISQLQNNLTAPANGWKLEYQPTSTSGIYLIFLDFDDNGQVVVRSDVADNNGEFAQQTLQYRIDSGLGLELILETFGVFHYLFEQDFATFGAEFEFIFDREEGQNLVFRSKTDTGVPTELVFIPAQPGEENAISIGLANMLNNFDGNHPRIFGGIAPIQHIIFHNKNLSLFWEIDVPKREIEVDIVGVGTTVDEVLTNIDTVGFNNHTTGYRLSNGKLILERPFTFTLQGEEITIAELEPTTIDFTGATLCASTPISTPVLTGTAGDLGPITILRTQFDSDGLDFQPMADRQYSVNAFFVFTNDPISLQENGSIAEKLPETLVMLFNYGFSSEDGEPANAVGFLLEDAAGNRRTYMREFQATTTVANRVQITLTDDFYFSETPGASDEQSLREITDEIFGGGGELYAFEFPQDANFKIFHMYNPCNGYEFFLVQ